MQQVFLYFYISFKFLVQFKKLTILIKKYFLGYFLNPVFQYVRNRDMSIAVQNSTSNVITRLEPDVSKQIQAELEVLKILKI
jgi:hypothetical protein